MRTTASYSQAPLQQCIVCKSLAEHHMCRQDTMTDLLCESAKLDDWMKEVVSGGTPDTFQDESPPQEEAGAPRCRPACWLSTAATHTIAANATAVQDLRLLRWLDGHRT